MKNRLILHTVIGLSLIGSWVLLVYLPLSKRQAAMDGKIKTEQQQLHDLRESITLLPHFLSTQSQLEHNRRALDDRLFGKSEILDLFRELDILAKGHSLRLVEVSPPLLELLKLEQTVTDTTTPPFLTLRLTIVGEYLRFGRFVAELEQADFYRTPQRCKISAAKDPSLPTTYELEFSALLGSTGGVS